MTEETVRGVEMVVNADAPLMDRRAVERLNLMIFVVV